ncbi:hypothetical protein PGT21_026480 [Puccinia graminis f. sp. tritici]|uniref:Uncharacterized protein n=1 Tax=Puccinia graminis f. sp. tritici TaxID=56615 RepID=A0A5B0QJG0_PUCGR|nr:hypothetical protein PGT21_026480 [Puccinia graminis f. sp. tritici]
MHVHKDPLATLISMVVILDVMMAPVLGHYAAVKRVRKGNENLTCFNCPREGYQAAYKGQRTLSVSSHNTGRGCSLLTSQSSETSACPGIVSGKEWTCDVCRCVFFRSQDGCLTCNLGPVSCYFTVSGAQWIPDGRK